MENTETQEMYLVIIDKLSKKRGTVRIVDIAEERNFSKSTVHEALKTLKALGLVEVEPGNIYLTEEGKKKVEELKAKHDLMVVALKTLGASDALAEENACRIEHVMSDEMYELLKRHVESGSHFLEMMKKHGK